MLFKVTDVKFDTDGDKKLAAKLAKMYKGWVFEAEDEADADERAADILSDHTGWCVFHVAYEPNKPHKGRAKKTTKALRSGSGDNKVVD